MIIGGGVIGSSTAYFLAEAGHAADVVVIEPDPTYEWSATARSSGGIRQLFSLPENILMSQFGLRFYADFNQAMAVNGELAEAGLRHDGYMFLVSGEKDLRVIEQNWKTQTGLGARVDLLDRNGVRDRFPSIRVDDIDGGVHSPDDGTIDPYGVLTGFRRKAISLGVSYLKDRVVGLTTSGPKVTRVKLESGNELAPDVVLNAANVWAPGICEMIGFSIPVEPVRRNNFYFEVKEKLEPIPRTKDSTEVSFRMEGRGYAAGLTNRQELPGFNWDVDYSWFDEEVWPRLAHRIPAFEALKVHRGWAGLFDMNRFDANPILGTWPGGPENFHIAAGFSGHGIQAAPAVGRAMKELMIDGGFQTIDLDRLSSKRLFDNAPAKEMGFTS
jgi:glycine/D-amino acid oxidase-like deaminating enzyme